MIFGLARIAVTTDNGCPHVQRGQGRAAGATEQNRLGAVARFRSNKHRTATPSRRICATGERFTSVLRGGPS